MVKIQIDGKYYEVKPGKNLLETCLAQAAAHADGRRSASAVADSIGSRTGKPS